eukprot:1412898-Alexandrium_andersonii.AAC.1
MAQDLTSPVAQCMAQDLTPPVALTECHGPMSWPNACHSPKSTAQSSLSRCQKTPWTHCVTAKAW